MANRVIIGEFRSDLEADKIAETKLTSRFANITITHSIEGRRLVPIQEIAKIEQALEKEKEEAYKRGYAEGRRTGKEEGYLEAKKVIDNFAGLIKDAISQREALYNDARKEILELILKIARKVTFSALQVDPNLTAEIISNVIRRLIDKTKIKIKVHPNHLPMIQSQIERFRGDSPDVKEMTIEADARVRYGGCIIETPSEDIDARVESQLEIITESLREAE
jgi:flagellar assembly protein FliH